MTTYTIVDLDGTLFDDSARSVYAERGMFDTYHSRFPYDRLNQELATELRAMQHKRRIIILSGRPIEYKAATADFLEQHGVPYHHLYLKPPAHLTVPSEAWKEAVIKELGLIDNFNSGRISIHAYDNEPAIIDMYQRHGIPATLVNLK